MMGQIIVLNPRQPEASPPNRCSEGKPDFQAQKDSQPYPPLPPKKNENE